MIKSSMGARAPFILSFAFAGMVTLGMHTVSHQEQAIYASAVEVSQTPTQLAQTHSQAKQKKLADRIAKHYNLEKAFAQDVVDMAHEAADKQGVDPVLLLALVGVESSFNPKAVSHANAKGLTQVIAKWHPEKVQPLVAQGRSIMEPKTNLTLGAQILAEYQRKFKGDRILALQQYNGSLKDRSRKYSRKVIGMYDLLSRDPARG